MKSYCKDCQERHEGCHSKCGHYREFLKENEKIKDARHRESEKRSFKIESCRRGLQATDGNKRWGALGYSRKEKQK